jgi:Glycosyl transferase family 2
VPLVIVTQSRGDASRLAEWVTYHSRLGFEEIHVILDGLIDDSDEVLESLDVADDVPARVVVHRYPEEGVYYDGLSPEERMRVVQQWRQDNAEMLAALPHKAVDPQSLRQRRRVTEVLGTITEGRRGWVAHIDADEFIHLPGGGSIRDLTRAADTPRLRFLSFDVDTAGHDPSRPVLDQHRVRWAREDVEAHPDSRWATRVKSMVRFRVALPLRSLHRINAGRHEVVDPDVGRLHHFRVPMQPIDPPIPFTVDDPVGMPALR